MLVVTRLQLFDPTRPYPQQQTTTRALDQRSAGKLDLAVGVGLHMDQVAVAVVAEGYTPEVLGARLVVHIVARIAVRIVVVVEVELDQVVVVDMHQSAVLRTVGVHNPDGGLLHGVLHGVLRGDFLRGGFLRGVLLRVHHHGVHHPNDETLSFTNQ